SKKTSRNEYWTNTVNKYGYYWEIVKRFNNHHCALTYEKIVINNLGMANLVNLTYGGDGSHGFKPPWSKVVTCSNGMVFESAKAASRWANNGRGRQSIVDCCNGKQPAALGYSWG